MASLTLPRTHLMLGRFAANALTLFSITYIALLPAAGAFLTLRSEVLDADAGMISFIFLMIAGGANHMLNCEALLRLEGECLSLSLFFALGAMFIAPFLAMVVFAPLLHMPMPIIVHAFLLPLVAVLTAAAAWLHPLLRRS